MQVQVILQQPVKKLGAIGKVVKVQAGHARNYLLPKKIAIRATKANIELMEKHKHTLEEHNNVLRAKAEEIAKTLQGQELIFVKQTADDGRLYGSVSNKDIAKTLSEITSHRLVATQIGLYNPLKTIGAFKFRVDLHPEISVDVSLSIGRTENEAKDLLRNAKVGSNEQSHDSEGDITS
jgi:large subunit ribosomal protein L9